jgi:hypothetical protein
MSTVKLNKLPGICKVVESLGRGTHFLKLSVFLPTRPFKHINLIGGM